MICPRDAQLPQQPDELVDVVQAVIVDRRNEQADLGLNRRQLLPRGGLGAHDFLELADGGAGGGADFVQGSGQVERLGVGQPVIGIADGLGVPGDVHVEIGVRVLFLDDAQHLVALGQAADDVLVADLVEVAVGQDAGRAVVRAVGRLPDLDGVMLLGLLVRPEEEHRAVLEQAEAVAEDRRLHLLGDHVVAQQHIQAGLEIVERIQKVLAVGRRDALVEDHVLHGAVEELHVAGLEEIAPREDDPVVVVEQDAGVLDGVDADGLLGLDAVDDVSKGLFLVGADPEQDQVAQDRVEDLGVVEGLVGVLDRLAVDTLAGGGVVLHLERQIAPVGLDEHLFFDADVRVIAVHLHVAGGPLPVEAVLARQDVFVVAAVVHVLQRVALDEPLERLDVRDVPADLEDHEQVWADDRELREDRAAVVFVEVGEVRAELLVVDEREVQRRQAAALPLQHAEHVLQQRLARMPRNTL